MFPEESGHEGIILLMCEIVDVQDVMIQSCGLATTTLAMIADTTETYQIMVADVAVFCGLLRTYTCCDSQRLHVATYGKVAAVGLSMATRTAAMCRHD